MKAIPALQKSIEERAHRVAMQEEEARRMAALAGYAEGRTGGIGRKGGRGGRRLTAEEVDRCAFQPAARLGGSCRVEVRISDAVHWF